MDSEKINCVSGFYVKPQLNTEYEKKTFLTFKINDFLLVFSLKFILHKLNRQKMYWTLELASYLSDAPWPANKTNLLITLSCRSSIRSSRIW
jgi:hypothetical protein